MFVKNYCFFSILMSATLTSATLTAATLTSATLTVGAVSGLVKVVLPFWFVWWVCVIWPSGLKTVFVAWTTPLFDVITDEDPTTPVGISSSPKRLSNVVDTPWPPNGAPNPGAPKPGCAKGSKINKFYIIMISIKNLKSDCIRWDGFDYELFLQFLQMIKIVSHST